MNITISSFGYKHAPPESDTAIDVRFLPNPYYVPELSAGTGQEDDVSQYVLNNNTAQKFFQHFEPLLFFYIQAHADADRESFHLGFGCTGGRHRSVAVAEKIVKILKDQGLDVDMFHRDIDKV